MNQPKMFEKKKKKRSDEFFLDFSIESSESYRFSNNLQDSNSNFRARGINSENIFRRAVLAVAICLINCWRPTERKTRVAARTEDNPKTQVQFPVDES